MSTIIADNLTGKTAAGDVTVTSEGGAATLQLQQGLAKSWVNGDTDASILDSTNVSSSSDIGTGQYQYNFTNNIVNALYAGSGASENGAVIFSINQTGKATSSYRVRNVTHADVDIDMKHGSDIHGDLA